MTGALETNSHSSVRLHASILKRKKTWREFLTNRNAKTRSLSAEVEQAACAGPQKVRAPKTYIAGRSPIGEALYSHAAITGAALTGLELPAQILLPVYSKSG